MNYIKRIIEYTKSFPVTALTGSRQSEKSTTLIKLFKGYRYISFDDYKISEYCTKDSEVLWNNIARRIFR